jgi:TonB family protein
MRKALAIFMFLAVAALGTTAQSKLNATDNLLQQTRQEIGQGNFAAAELDLTTALAQAQSNHDLRREVLADEAFSSLKERQNNLESAEQWLNKAADSLKQSPGASAQLLALVDLQGFYSRHKLYSKEVDAITRIIAVWSSTVARDSIGVSRYTALLGKVYLEMGDTANSEASLRSAVAIFDKNGMSSSNACDDTKRTLLKVLMKEEKRADVAGLIPSMHPDPPKREHPDVFPQLIFRAEPTYPEAARKRNLMLSGSVLISLDVDDAGHPQNLQVIGPLGLGFDEAALAAVSSWTFKPATKGGAPMATRAMVEVNFRTFPTLPPPPVSSAPPQDR